MKNTRPKMNPTKTEFIEFGSRSQLDKTNQNSISVLGDSIGLSNTIHYLGAWLDRNLRFDTHVTMKCKSAICNIFKLMHVCRYIDQETCEILVCSLVLSHVDYSNGILIGCMKSVQRKLQ